MLTEEMLSIRITQVEESVCIAVKGNVDVSTAPELLDSFQNAFGSNPRSIALDVSELVYMDSVGLGVLVSAYKRAQAAKTRFVLSPPTASILRLFELTGLIDVFEFEEMPDGACNDL